MKSKRPFLVEPFAGRKEPRSSAPSRLFKLAETDDRLLAGAKMSRLAVTESSTPNKTLVRTDRSSEPQRVCKSMMSVMRATGLGASRRQNDVRSLPTVLHFGATPAGETHQGAHLRLSFPGRECCHGTTQYQQGWRRGKNLAGGRI